MRLLRVLAVLTALVMLGAACGGDDDDVSAEDDATTTTEAPTTTTEASEPDDPAAARAEIEAAFATFVNDELPTDENLAVIQDGESLRDTYEAAEESNAEGIRVRAQVTEIEFTGATTANVTFSLFNVDDDAEPLVPDLAGDAVVVDGQWKVSRNTYCDLIALGGTECPPEDGEGATTTEAA